MISGLRMDADGLALLLNCPACSAEFEDRPHLISGIGLGSHICPSCGHRLELQPNDLVAAAARCWPEPAAEERELMHSDAVRIVSSWYREELIAGVLYFHGINLGDPCAHDLLALANWSLYLNHISS